MILAISGGYVAQTLGCKTQKLFILQFLYKYSKDEVKKKYGDDQFLKWRRGYDTPPPELEKGNDMNPANDPLYSGINNLPLSECLKDTYERVIPYWEKSIMPLLSGKIVLISAHGNSLRALCKKLFGDHVTMSALTLNILLHSVASKI